MRIVVTGGQGHLGRHVMAALAAAGHEAVTASRRSGVDVATGAGLDAALEGADAVVHAADTTNPRRFRDVTVGGSARVAAAATRATTRPHVVYVSIVGVDRNPYAYYRSKLGAEQALERSAGSGGAPATVLRATQFHSLAALFARIGRIGPVVLGLRGMRVQPVDVGWVAQRLAELATGPRPTAFARAVDVAGPDRFDLATMSRLVAEHEGRTPPRTVGLPALGGTMRAFAEGTILPGPEAELGGETFVDWLGHQPLRLRGR
jgi:uncharacterized protein YbjT (DUF2867 family)